MLISSISNLQVQERRVHELHQRSPEVNHQKIKIKREIRVAHPKDLSVLKKLTVERKEAEVQYQINDLLSFVSV